MADHESVTITDEGLEIQRIVGEIHLVLEDGSVEDRASMLRLLASYRTPEDYREIRDSHGLNDDGTTA